MSNWTKNSSFLGIVGLSLTLALSLGCSSKDGGEATAPAAEKNEEAKADDKKEAAKADDKKAEAKADDKKEEAKADDKKAEAAPAAEKKDEAAPAAADSGAKASEGDCKVALEAMKTMAKGMGQADPTEQEEADFIKQCQGWPQSAVQCLGKAKEPPQFAECMKPIAEAEMKKALEAAKKNPAPQPLKPAAAPAAKPAAAPAAAPAAKPAAAPAAKPAAPAAGK